MMGHFGMIYTSGGNMNAMLLYLRELRLELEKKGKNAVRVKQTIELLDRIEKGKKIKKSMLLRIMADLMDLNKGCVDTEYDFKQIDSLAKFLFPEFNGRYYDFNL